MTLALGLSSLAESEVSHPDEWNDHKVHAWRDAAEFAESLFDWLCKGGYYPSDRAGCDKLLDRFGYDSNPTRLLTGE